MQEHVKVVTAKRTIDKASTPWFSLPALYPIKKIIPQQFS